MAYVSRTHSENLYGIDLNKFVLTQDLKTTLYKPTLVVTAKSTGNFALYTTETGMGLFYPQIITFTAAIITTHTSVAHISVGITGTGYTDILADFTCTGLTATGAYINSGLLATSAAAGVPAGTTIYAKINTAAVGTVETYAISIQGYYDDYLATSILPS